jgi:hypothetical protein
VQLLTRSHDERDFTRLGDVVGQHGHPHRASIDARESYSRS